MGMVTSEDEHNVPSGGTSGGVGGASPAGVSSPVLNEVYLEDNYGYCHGIEVSIDEYIMRRRKVSGITDKYVKKVLEELMLEYLDELDKCEALREIEEEAWKEGCDDVAYKLKEEVEARIACAQSELVEKTYKLLPAIWDELEEEHFVVVLADGRRFWADWEAGLKVWKARKWKVVEVRE
jgi:hypothetical protein